MGDTKLGRVHFCHDTRAKDRETTTLITDQDQQVCCLNHAYKIMSVIFLMKRIVTECGGLLMNDKQDLGRKEDAETIQCYIECCASK